MLSGRCRPITLRLLSCCLAVAFLWLAPVGYAQRPQSSPNEPSKITSVQQLMPFARFYVGSHSEESHLKSSLGAKAGDKILLLAEASVDSLVVEALRTAVLEIGSEFNVILLHGSSQEEDPVKLESWPDTHDLLPRWVWDAMEQATIVANGFPMGAHSMTRETREWFRQHKIRHESFRFYSRELLAMLPMNYPDELYDAINVKVWRQIYGAKQIRITDPNGTDLVVELDDGYWERAREDRQAAMGPGGRRLSSEEPINWGHIQVSPMLSTKWESGRGIIVATSMHGGQVPKTKLQVENGRVVKAEGEGFLYNYVNLQLTKFNNLRFPLALGLGMTYLAEITIGTDPKARRPLWEGLRGQSKRMNYSEGRERSGVIHVAWGTPTTTVCVAMKGCAGQEQHDFAKAHGTAIQHLDVELYHVTYYADGKKIIDKGHLLALDDPEIRRIAAKHGDPDQLLRQDWIPDMVGR